MWQNFLMQESGAADSEERNVNNENTHIAEIKQKPGPRYGSSGGNSVESDSVSSSDSSESHKTSHLRSYAPSNFNKNTTTSTKQGIGNSGTATSVPTQGFASIMSTINSQTTSKTLQNINLSSNSDKSKESGNGTTSTSAGSMRRMPPNIVNPNLAVSTAAFTTNENSHNSISNSSSSSSVASDITDTTPPGSPYNTGFSLVPESPIFSPSHQ